MGSTNKTITFLIYLFIIAENKAIFAETNYLPPDPFIVMGDSNDFTSAEEIANKISLLQDQNKKMRSKVLQLQDLLIAKFKDRMELKVEVIAKNNIREMPQFAFVELSALLNNIAIIHYSKPVFYDKIITLPIFSGPLPLGKYEIKLSGVVGQFNNNWPYVLPQGKWKVDKKIEISGTLNSSVHNVKIFLRQNSLTKLPELITEEEELKESQ